MRTTSVALFLCLLAFGGCESAPPPPPPIDAIPLAKDLVLPPGMPDDQWFYDEVVSSDVPVIVDFGATWCGPCNLMKPVLERLKSNAQGRYKVVMVDVDERPYLSDQFQVTGVPRMMLVVKGEVKRNLIGVHTYEELLEIVTAPST